MRNRLFVLAALTVAIALAAHAQTYTESTLHTFTAANPVGTVTVDSSGNLYGALGWTGACQPGKTAEECGRISIPGGTKQSSITSPPLPMARTPSHL